MARSSDPAKAAQWQRRLERFGSSSLSVARFCQREKVSVASFYHWRKKLAAAINRDSAPHQARAAAAVFRPVMVVAPAQAVNVHLPGGARLELPAENLDLVRTIVDQLVHADRTRHEMPASSRGPGGASC